MHLGRGTSAREVNAWPTYDPDRRGWRRNLPFFSSVWSLLRRARDPDVVHVHISNGGSLLREGAIIWLARMRGTPVVATVHGSGASQSGFLVSWLYWFATLPAFVHGFSDAYRRNLHVPQRRWIQVPNDVLPRPSHRRPGNAAVFAGEVGRRKGVDVLLDAWESAHLYPTWELKLIGPSGDVSLPEESPIPGVHAAGPLPHNGVLAEFDRAAVMVLPSRAEAFPMAVCEALMAGCPVIGTDVGAMGVLLRQAGQFVVPPGDPDALCAAITMVLGEPELRFDAGHRARSYAIEHLGSDVVTEMWFELYARIAGVEK